MSSYASASIYAESIARTSSGFVYDIHCAISWGYRQGKGGSAVTYQKLEGGDWSPIHTKQLSFEDYVEWAFRKTFPLSMNGQTVSIQMGVPGIIGSNKSTIHIGLGLMGPSPVVPSEPTPTPTVPPYVPPTQPEPTVTPPTPEPPTTSVYNFTRVHGMIFSTHTTLTKWGFAVRNRFIGSRIHEIVHPLI